MRNFSSRKTRKTVGTKRTSKLLSEILPQFAKQFAKEDFFDPSLALKTWPDVIGSSLAGMTSAEKFVDGILYVRVTNSSLYSLLAGYEKQKLLQRMQEILPSSQIRDIFFRIG